MKQPNHDELIKLNERLDTLLSSDKALEAAAQSKSPEFRAVAELIRAEHPQVDSAMRERMRAKMLQAVPEVKTPQKQPILRPNFTTWATRIAAVVLIFLFVALLTPPALASSLPGDALYPAKRGLENFELLFAGDSLGQANVHFSQSERRLHESERLLAKGRFDTSLMDDALASLENGIRIANDHNLFEENLALEARSSNILSTFNTTLDTAAAAQLIETVDLVRLEGSEQSVSAFLPSRMEDPSSSSEVTAADTSPEILEAPTAESTAPSVVDAEATEAPIETLEETLVYVNAAGNVNVREGAGTAYGVIAQIASSSSVTALAMAGDWTQVRLADGRVGWIANFLLSSTSPVVEETVITDPTESSDGTSGTVDTGTSNSTGATTGAIPNPTPCVRGRSCDAPGHGNSQGGSSNGNANGGN